MGKSMPNLRIAYRNLDPAAPVDGHRASYYVPRHNDRLLVLAEELAASRTLQHILLVGQRGVGKTTELSRLFEFITGRRRVSRLHIQQPIVNFDRNTVLSACFSKLDFEIINSYSIEDILLIDGCERLQAPGVIHCLSALARLETSAVVIAPSWVSLRGHHGAGELGDWDRVIPISAMPVTYQSQNSLNQDVVQYLSEVIDCRVGSGVFTPDALRQLAIYSGGIHRDMISLAQQACIRAAVVNKDVVTETDADTAIQDRRQELLFSLTPAERRVLLKLADGADPLVEEIDYIPLIERNLLIMYYTDCIWLAVHPLVNPKSAPIQIAKV
jgi:GTPase SAR1 family protein